MMHNVEREVLQYIAANVRRRRLALGITQEQLAAAADIDVTFLQRVERASTNLSVAVLVRLASALGIAPQALLRPRPPLPRRAGRPRARR